MSLLKKLASETALYGLSSILGRLLTFVCLTPYLTRQFAPTDMGVQTDIYAWSAFLMVLFSYRLETAFFRFGASAQTRPRAYSTALSMAYVSTLGLVLLLWLGAAPIAAWLEYPQHPEYVIYFAAILGLDAVAALPFARLRMEGKAKRFAFIKLANLAVHLVSTVILLEGSRWLGWELTGDRVGYVFIANLLASAATLLLLAPQLRPIAAVEGGLSPQFDPEQMRQMLRYALPLAVASVAGIINEVLDRVLLKMMLAGTLEMRLEQVGIYGSCYKIAIFMNLFTQAFNYAAEPFFFRHADRADSRQLYAHVTYAFALIGCLGFVGIMCMMDLGQYFVAARYRSGLGVVPILLLANLFLGIYYNLAVWYKLGNRTQFGAAIGVFGALITIICNVILIPFLGYMGAAWATLVCYASMVGICYALGQRYYPIPYEFGRILGHIAAAILFYTAFWAIQPQLPADFWLRQLVNIAAVGLYAVGLVALEGRRVRQMWRQSA